MKNNRCKKAVGVIALVCCLLLSMIPMPVYANPDAESLVLDVPEDAIILSTPEDVCALAENCRVNTWSVGKTVALAQDIDMSKVDFQGIPTFGGTFLGQGYKISGIHLKADGSEVGFFRYLQKTAVVEKLRLEGVVQPQGSKNAVGGLVGNNAGIIRNCTTSVVVSGYEQIGGIVGINETSGVIENCTVTGVAYGSHFVGGLVGENHGVVRYSINKAEINTQSVQNAVDLEDITLDSLSNTESVNTATNIGGVAGNNSGVIRGCINAGAVGYQSMGYNIGGIVGSQNGYVVDCFNYADVQGRKEVGGIVGHMEPNIVINFTQDSLQELQLQMDDLKISLDSLTGSMKDTTSDIDNQVDEIEKEIENIENAMDVLTHPVEVEGEEKLEDEKQEIEDALEKLEDEELRDNLGKLDEEELKETLEDLKEVEVSINEDRLTAAQTDLSNSIDKVYSDTSDLQNSLETASDEMVSEMEALMTQMEQLMESMNNLEEGINLSVEDVSGNDIEADTIGKVSTSINYGKITGEYNIGGIAGIMAEENDLEAYSDTTTYGDTTLNMHGQIRVVIRDCKNEGTIVVNKNYGGGIAGYMFYGAVLESVNIGNIDAINADYVGGIVGESNTIIRNCSSKSIISGDTNVGGIAGKGNEVRDCYAFVSIKAGNEKIGAILGDADELPDGTVDIVTGNYYFVDGRDIGGIDGISYTGSTTKYDLAGFLQLPNLDETLKTVRVRFLAEGQENIELTVNVGEALAMDALPTLDVEADSEYEWIFIPAVTEEILGMGELEKIEYLTEEKLTNILFDQTYEASFGLKNTVIKGSETNKNGLAILLAEGSFAKGTTVEMRDMISEESIIVNGETAIVNYNITLSNTGVKKIHYILPEDTKEVKLYVKDASGNLEERDYIVDGSYMIFEFLDGETGFALVESAGINMMAMILIAAGVIPIALGIIITKKNKKK